MIIDYTEIDASPMASQQLKYFAELEEQEGSGFEVDDYEYQQCLGLDGASRLACEALNREFDL